MCGGGGGWGSLDPRSSCPGKQGHNFPACNSPFNSVIQECAKLCGIQYWLTHTVLKNLLKVVKISLHPGLLKSVHVIMNTVCNNNYDQISISYDTCIASSYNPC